VLARLEQFDGSRAGHRTIFIPHGMPHARMYAKRNFSRNAGRNAEPYTNPNFLEHCERPQREDA